MIIGVTHDTDDSATYGLSVVTKVAIGMPPQAGRNYPSKLDHFVFLRKKRTAKGVEWEPDPELMTHYGSACRAFEIMLIDDDIDNVFPSAYSWWTATERKCWGEGTQATRRTPEHSAGEPWTPCGSPCSELASGLRKPSGDLRFVLADFPRLGSVCRIHTGSYRSIRQIHSALEEIQTFTGGRLAGITAKLLVRPEQAVYFDRNEQRKKTTTIWALSLEVDGDDIQKLVSKLTGKARLFAETRKQLGWGDQAIEVVEDEDEQAPEISTEFYPPSDAVSEATESAGENPATIESLQGPSAPSERGSSAAPNAAVAARKTGTKPLIMEPKRKTASEQSEAKSATSAGTVNGSNRLNGGTRRNPIVSGRFERRYRYL